MIPRLYKADEGQFVTQGFGGLGDARIVRVKRQVNGAYELEMTYPVSGRRFSELLPRRIIRATADPDEGEQSFRIYRISKPLEGFCTVYARHIAYDLMGYTLRPFVANSLSEATQQLQSGAAVQSHGFTIGADFDRDTPCNVATPRSVWSMLGGQKGSLLDIYGAEWELDNTTCTLKERLGADLGVTVRYGVNLQTLEQEENLANTWTGVQPYWQSADGLTVVTLPEDILSTGEFDYTRVLVLDLSAEWPEPPTEEQLRSRTRQYITDNKVGIPAVGLDVKFIPLDQTEEYKGRSFLQKIHLGDTVSVEFPTAYDRATGAPRAFVMASARAVETVWLPLEEKYESVRLGEKRASFVSALAQVQKNTAWLMTKVGR